MTEQEQRCCPFCGAKVDLNYGSIYFCGTEVESELRGETYLRNQIAQLQNLLREVEEVFERCNILVLHYEKNLKQFGLTSDFIELYQTVFAKIKEAAGKWERCS